ncbi:MAG: ROK family protein [Planctomycetaceae bacterium]|jgi:glucokinase
MSTLVAGVDLGGTTASLALAHPDGTVECETRIDTESYQGPLSVLERIAEGLLGLAREAGEQPATLGIGLPGLVDIERGISKFMPNLPTNWVDIEVAGILTSHVGCPVAVINDARAATLGELRFGHGREARSLALFTLGTGIGGGLAIDGRLRLGPVGAAGEFGHLAVIPYGPLCGCGNRGCLETLISGPALTGEAVRLMRSGRAPILNDLVAGDISLVTPRTMAEAARAGDTVLKSTITSRSEYLGIGVANVVTVVHPEIIVLSGGVAEMGELILEPVRRTIRERVSMVPVDSVRVEKSLIGERAGLYGTLAYAADALAAGV